MLRTTFLVRRRVIVATYSPPLGCVPGRPFPLVATPGTGCAAPLIHARHSLLCGVVMSAAVAKVLGGRLAFTAAVVGLKGHMCVFACPRPARPRRAASLGGSDLKKSDVLPHNTMSRAQSEFGG
eukprot:5638618-Prymnesium_polylepis.2